MGGTRAAVRSTPFDRGTWHAGGPTPFADHDPSAGKLPAILPGRQWSAGSSSSADGHRQPRLDPTTILRLQATRGNAHVRGLLIPASGHRADLPALAPSPPILRASLDDAGPTGLTSPRFAGEPTLEACFRNQARLSPGERGDPVTRVQQALSDLGFDLGPAGIDGSYGAATANAIKRFKTEQRLGSEQFGDVGPGTMGRLDLLFGPAREDPPIPPKLAAGDDSACPFTPDDLITALADQQPETETETGADSSLVTAPGGTASPHLKIPDVVTKFQTAVNPSGVSAGDSVTARGQFFWSVQVSEAIRIELILLDDPADRVFAAKAEAARIASDSGKNIDGLLAELKDIADRSKSPHKSQMQSLLAPVGRGGATSHEVDLWKAYIKDGTNARPNVSASKSLRVLAAMNSAEKIACFSHVEFVTQKLKTRGGLQPRDKSVRPINAVLANPDTVRDRRPDPAGSATHKGDVFTQRGVGGVVAEMKRALDAGQVIHARATRCTAGAQSPPACDLARRSPAKIAHRRFNPLA